MTKITLLIIICMISYAGLLVSFSRAPISLNSNIVGVIINGLGTLVPLGLYVFVTSQRTNPEGAINHGLLWAVFGGICLAAFTLSLTFLFAGGERVSFVAPLVYGFAVLASSLIAILFFSEKVSTSIIIGLLLIVAGISTISFSVYRESREQAGSLISRSKVSTKLP